MSRLVTDHLPLLAGAPNGVKKLRELILQLAVTGRLDKFSGHAWRKFRLGDIGTWGSGGTPAKTHSEYYGGEIPWLVIGDLNDGLVTQAGTTITAKGLVNSSAKLIPPGTVLIAMYGSIGKMGVAGIHCATNQAIAHCQPDESKVCGDYLFVLLQSIRKQLVNQGQGLAQQNISQKILKATEIALPTITEQRSIVAKVNELMSLCDCLETRQSDAQAAHARLVDELLGSLLQARDAEDFAECWGRVKGSFDALFTTEQSVELLKRTILGLGMTGGLSARGSVDKWEKIKVADAGHIKLGRQRSPKDHHGPNMVQYLRVANVLEAKIDTTDVKSMNFTPEEQKTFRLLPGDILLNEGQSKELVGRPAIFNDEVPGVCFQNTLLRFRCYDRVTPSYALKYFLHCMYSGIFQKYAQQTTNIAHLSSGRLATIDFLLPPLEEQRRIVAKVDEFMGLCDRIKAKIARAQALNERLAGALVERAVL